MAGNRWPHRLTLPAVAVVSLMSIMAASPSGPGAVALLYPPAAVAFAVAVFLSPAHLVVCGGVLAAFGLLVDPRFEIPTYDIVFRAAPVLVAPIVVRWLRRGPFGGHTIAAASRLWFAWAVTAVTTAAIIAGNATAGGAIKPTANAVAGLWEEVAIGHAAGLFTLAPLLMVAVGRVGPFRHPLPWSMAVYPIAGAAVAMLALTGAIPPLGVAGLAVAGAMSTLTTPMQAAVLTASLAAVLQMAVAWEIIPPANVGLSQASVVALALLVGAVQSLSAMQARTRRHLRRERAGLASVIDAVADPLMMLGVDGAATSTNPAARDLLDWVAAHGRTLRWVAPDGTVLHRGAEPKPGVSQDRRVGAVTETETRWFDVAFRPVPEGDAKRDQVVTFRDVTDEVAAAQMAAAEVEAMRRQVNHDVLSGALNRHGLISQLEHAQQLSATVGSRLGLMYVDLDTFKAVNDDWGHAVGDEVLVQVALRLRAAAGPDRPVARVGGDEFVVLCAQLPLTTAPTAMTVLADRVESAMAGPFDTSAGPVTVSASVGWSLLADDEDVTEALHRAGQAMHAAKRLRPGRLPALAAQTPASTAVRVFIVDDDPAMRLLAARELEGHPGIDVVGEAADGAAAVSQIPDAAVSVVLCDVMLPRMSGREVLTAVRQRQPDVPFLFWSAAGHHADLVAVQSDVPWLPKDRLDELAPALLAVAVGDAGPASPPARPLGATVR